MASEIRNLTNDVKRFANNVIDTTHKALREFSMHFPRSLLIASIANTIITILSASLSGYIGFALNCYFLYQHKNHMLEAIAVHDERNINEWRSSYKEKQDLIPLIESRVIVNNIATVIRNALSKIF